MSLLFAKRGLGDTNSQLVPPRMPVSAGMINVTPESALRQSTVWACLRLRADLISTLPLNVYRAMPNGVNVTVTTPPVLVSPGGADIGIEEWLYSTQFDLDRCGNSFGIIVERDGNGLPKVIQLVPFTSVTVKQKAADNSVTYRIGSTTYEPGDIWHEKQYTMSGLPVGLSPIGYAASSIGQYLSAQQFALDWFANGATPTGILKNKAKVLDAGESEAAKRRFKAAQASRDIFATGADWDYNMISVPANESQFLETMDYGLTDVCRFFGVPSDMVDAEPKGKGNSSITYANVTQRNLQLLILNLGPAIVRRENKFSRDLVAQPRLVRFDTSALLRMDAQTRSAMLGQQIVNRQIAPSEARAVDNREPFTTSQLAEFDRLFGTPSLVQPQAPQTGVPIS